MEKSLQLKEEGNDKFKKQLFEEVNSLSLSSNSYQLS
jgi:hypothetical protein